MNISDKIKKARQADSLTQQEVADKLNISRKTLSGWENNRSIPDLEMLKSLANVFDKDLNYFLEIERKEFTQKRLFWLYWINFALFSVNFIITVFTKIQISGLSAIELLIVILFTIGNQQQNKLEVRFKFFILFFLLLIFFVLSINHSFNVIPDASDIAIYVGSLARAIVLTWSFYCILKFSKIL